MSCPLCNSSDPPEQEVVEGRPYLDCPVCRLVFLEPGRRLTSGEERARYEAHDNKPGDPGYRAFLERLATPLSLRLTPGAEGLDFGSGPGPTLSIMMAERGFPMRVYDPFFAADPEVLGGSYDFVTCTETLEHLFRPGAELERLATLLRPGGLLGIMTEILRPETIFTEWWYRRDPTHVSFYRNETLEWIGDRFGWSMERPHRNVVIYRTD